MQERGWKSGLFPVSIFPDISMCFCVIYTSELTCYYVLLERICTHRKGKQQRKKTEDTHHEEHFYRKLQKNRGAEGKI